MKASFNSECTKCGKEIKEGQEIEKNDSGIWIHKDCKEKPTEQKNTKSTTIKPDGPFEESELIINWASDKAYKLSHKDITDINSLTTQQLSAIGQKEGMLTKLFTDTVLELMKINNIKSTYHKE